MDLHSRQIAKVVYEATRAYNGTIGQADQPSWEATTQLDRDQFINKVDALLRGQPYAPASIRPSDQVKAKLLAGIVGAFVLVYNPPPPPQAVVVPPAPPVPAIPVEKFEDPDTAAQALAQPDANIAKANEPTPDAVNSALDSVASATAQSEVGGAD